ncbi:rod-determining factor RdfA [Haloarcula pelagica]|uniref:rod-determining factor RdfA n=1 Tax=Haloarcula pelagica TaxID=3033389 RepID=UPI0024C28BDA|nr:rod-determining factor RdfA [Halomicroarcula sp. YJ-61-S]
MADTPDDRPASKVARLIDEYGLEGLGADLEARWTGEGVERMSLRDLAEFFNKRLLEQALLDAGLSALESDVRTTYENLTGDDVSTGVRTDARTRLERNGIDVDDLERDFVTYQAIRSYLKEWRGAEYEGLSDQEKIEKDLESIQRLMTRTLSVTEERIEKLRDTDRIDIDEFEVFLDAQVLCQQCGTQYSVAEFLEQGGCPCQQA